MVAVVTLASLKFPETTTIAVHEPNLLRLVSGANTIYTEAGANPRDENKNTEDGHGLDVEGCQKMLVDTGFSRILMGDGKSKLLSL